MLWLKAIVMSVLLTVLLNGIIRGWRDRDD